MGRVKAPCKIQIACNCHCEALSILVFLQTQTIITCAGYLVSVLVSAGTYTNITLIHVTKYQYQQFSHVLDSSCIGNIKLSPMAATPASLGEINSTSIGIKASKMHILHNVSQFPVLNVLCSCIIQKFSSLFSYGVLVQLAYKIWCSLIFFLLKEGRACLYIQSSRTGNVSNM